MFSIKNFGLTALLASMLVGCITHDENLLVGESASASATKIINSPRSAVAGNLLIKFNEQATLAFEKSERKSDITRSGIEPLNHALRTIGATSIERIFPINPQHEERARKVGLHRWYMVSFDSNEQLEKAAKSLAEVAEVDIVQYNRTFSLQPTISLPSRAVRCCRN